MKDYTKGIGNYVHYHAGRYKKYGINYNSTNGPGFFKTLVATRRDLQKLYKSKSIKISKNGWAYYAAFLNDIFYFEEKNKNKYNTSITAEDYKNAMDFTHDWVASQHDDINANITKLITGEKGVDRETAKRYSGLNRQNKKSKKYTQDITAKSVYKLLGSLKKSLRNVGKQAEKGVIGFDYLMKASWECKNYIEALNSLLEQANLTLNDAEISSKRVGRIREDATKQDYTELGAMLNNINNFIKINSLSFTNTLAGTAGEGFLAAATYVGGTVAEKAKKDIEKSLIGKNKQESTLSGFSTIVKLDGKDGLVEKINKNITNENMKWVQEDDVVVFSNGSQGTVDIDFKIDDGSALAKKMGVTDFRASMKNYSMIDSPLHPGVKLISKTPLTSILMLLDTDFVNHYLNLLSVHRGGKFLIDENKPTAPLYKAESIKANQMIQYATAVRAITGIRNKTYSDISSDCLIINDKATKTVHLIPSDVLLDGIYSNIDTFVNIEGLPNNFFNLNKWQTGAPDEDLAMARITDLIAGLHSFKLSMTLNPSAIRSFGVAPKSW